MAFQTTKWSWKQLATRLLLVPVLGGAAAGLAAAQSYQPGWRAPGTAPAMASPTASTAPMEPKDLLKLGRKALSEGKLDVAQNYAVQAEQAATAKKYSWGYFEDTPTSLRKDVMDASAKADKAQAAELYKKAKALYTSKASSDAERMANLDQALMMAQQSESRHGPYGMLEGDKPATLINEIKTAQEALRKKTGLMPNPNAGTAKIPAPTLPATATPNSPQAMPPVVMSPVGATGNPAKADVLRVVAEGRTLLAQDKVIEAKARGDVALKMAEEKGCSRSFAIGDDTPDALIAACKVKGGEMVRSLMADCDKQIALAAYERADAACNLALQISNGVGLYGRPIEEKKMSLVAKLKVTTPGVASVVPVAAANVPTMSPLSPVPPMTATNVPRPNGAMATLPSMPAPVVPTIPAPLTGGLNVAIDLNVPAIPAPLPAAVAAVSQGKLLIDNANDELRRGELEMARNLAIKAYNLDAAMKAEASAILKAVDVETMNRKRAEAATALNNALAVYSSRNYREAHAVMMRIDPMLLTADMKSKMDMVLADCTTQMSAVRQAAATDDDLKKGVNQLGQDVRNANVPLPVPAVPNASVPLPPAANEQKAVADILFEKLRAEAIETMKAAGTAWARGETDACMRVLEDYAAKVKASTLPEPRKLMLLKPIEARLQGYATMKHNYDYELKEARDKADAQNRRIGDRVNDTQRQEEIKKKIEEIRSLTTAGKYSEAESLGLQLKMLEPNDPAITAIYEQSKYRRRVEDNKRWGREDEQFTLNGLNDAERRGPYVDIRDPMKIDPQRALIAARRGETGTLRNMSPREFELEGRLSSSSQLFKFENMPLREALKQVHDKCGINITYDDPTLEEEKISLDSVIINEDLKGISLDNVLKIILSKAKLCYVIENDVVTITTPKRSRGRMKTKVFHVMDLVTPIPEYKLADHQSLSTAIQSTRMVPPALGNSNILPQMPRGMNGGELVSAGNGNGNGSGMLSASSSGTLASNAGTGPNTMNPQRLQYAEQLKKIITTMVNQGSWAHGNNTGGGTIEYFDIGGALVVNQTADVIKEVADLLESLRRLQDLSVAVEIRVISLSEAYFERIGVDFQANISTNNTTFERQLSTGVFQPQPFLNSFGQGVHAITGWSPATGLSHDLGVPIQPTSYNLTAPPFGGYQTSLSPTLNGGLSLGLAFLNDIQVYMFLEAAAGNQRINIMQAPKITLFNGQTSTIFVGDLAYFATGLQVYSANGQFVYLPVNAAYPIGQGNNPNGTGTGSSSGVSVTIQAIISSDRRFVRLNLTPSLTALASATVPLYPITTFITPVFEGGSQGQPIPFTQFFQQPSFTEISAQTTVAIPDGGTVLLGGLKTLAQGRNEFGPPVLSDIPYLNRLFKNVGIGQETRHVMMMVTPRIIINSEEEARQTGDSINGGLPPQP